MSRIFFFFFSSDVIKLDSIYEWDFTYGKYDKFTTKKIFSAVFSSSTE